MTISFRTKLLAIFGAALAALLAVLVVSGVMGVEQSSELDEVQSRLVPKAELGPRLDAQLERLSRALQDSVAAQDPAALAATLEHKTALFELVSGAGAALDPAGAASIRWAVQDYYQTGQDVSRRMIAGESDEALLQDVARMQAQQRKAQEVIKRSSSVDRRSLSEAFKTVRDTSRRADVWRMGIAGGGAAVVALLALWAGRGMLQALQNLSSGLSRFGTGDFRAPIPITARDDLGLVAEQANRMAESLLQLSQARERDDWLKSGVAGLGEQLRGDLEPKAVAEAALGFLVERCAAPAAALYLADDRGTLTLGATRGRADASEPAAAFGRAEGLLGQALLATEPSVVSGVPENYWRLKSGLGEAPPRQLFLLPLAHQGRHVGVLELGLLDPLAAEARELLLAVRAHLVIAIDAARARAARQQLLQETQAQAERLIAQEEELRLNNQELLAQQEELRRANAELESQRAELARKNGSLETARAVLAEKAEELVRVSSYKSQFLANMSHELRTPLNSMLLLSQLLAENDAGNIAPKQVEHLRTIHAAGQDLLTLINEVLDLSKIEAGKQELSLESVAPSHFAAFTRRLFEASAAHKGLALSVNVADDAPPTLLTDRPRVERILLNLLGNALKFTQRGTVTLQIGRPSARLSALAGGAGVAFSVSDTGSGIPEEAQARIFAPFEQVQGQSNRGHGGTGLGLPIARESARLLGGDVILEQSTRNGSTFVCVVPERTRLEGGSPQAAVSTVEDDAALLKAGEPHLLIIEDDPVLAEQLVDIAHARRLKVIVAANGAEGLRLAKVGQTLGIILDVNLPDLDGWSLMERLKLDPITRPIPVHFVSGVDDPRRGLALGAIGYLVKPASHADLAQAVRTLVPAKPSGRSVLVVEDDSAQAAAVLAVLDQAGFSGRHARSAEAALAQLAADDFGCVILDLGLPEMDGLGFLETLQRSPELGSPSVVIYTGRSLSKQETRKLEAYAEAIVLKNGSSFERLLEEVKLFVHHVQGRRPSPAERAPAPSPREDLSLQGVKLLLAEDDMRTVYSLSALLRGKGAEVISAETGVEALALLADHTDIQAVFMDVMMPEMDGYEAMRRLRQDPRHRTLPVLALTAKAMLGERERCLEAGASDYLSKPIDGEKLLSILKQLLRSRVA